MKRIAAGWIALALGAGLALADADHDHDVHDHEPRHGGLLVHSGDHHLELVAAGGTIDLYVTQPDGQEKDVSGAKATATVLANGKTETVPLAPAGANLLKGTGAFNAGKDTTVVISLTMPGHAPEQTRFRLD